MIKVIKTESQRKVLMTLRDKFKYDPNKRFQVINKYSERKHYVNNLKKKLIELSNILLMFIILPCTFIVQIYEVIKGLIPCGIVITSKEFINKKDEDIKIISVDIARNNKQQL